MNQKDTSIRMSELDNGDQLLLPTTAWTLKPTLNVNISDPEN